ncbi:MAG: outer membrane protein assembly factor BamB [Burkholderiales bacterium 66-5]|jgi:outer membrane assembly lipoprotein YfgL|nr:MAG: outer membrane protein assembly factor BamB [Burkholderiales bacterium 66-5]
MSAVRRSAKALAAGAVLAAALALAGCGSSKPKPAELGPPVALLPVHQAWHAQLGSVAGMVLVPAVHGEAVVLASEGGTVTGLDARTGGGLWRVQLDARLAAGVGTDGRRTAVVSKERQLIVIENGAEKWRRQLPAQTFTAPLVAGGRVFVMTGDRAVMAFDGETGYRLWNQQRQGEPLVLQASGLLTAVGDTLVAGLSGRMVGFDPDTGAIRWEAPLATPRGSNDVERLVELLGGVSREGNVLCARAFQAAVGCVDASRGALLWTRPAHGAQGVGGDAEALYGSESNGTVQAWKRADGAPLWTHEQLRYRSLTAPLVLGRSVVIGDETGQVHLLSREDGAPLNRLSTDSSGVAATPVAAGKTLVVVTRQGGVYGFRPD